MSCFDSRTASQIEGLADKLPVNFSPLISPKSCVNLVSLLWRQLAPPHRVFCERLARLSGCSGRFVKREWNWSDTPHKSSIVLLFNACRVPDWGQGQLSEEEQYGSDPPLLTRDLLQTHTYTNIEWYAQKRTQQAVLCSCCSTEWYITCAWQHSSL